jgi:hypothetical protein
MYNKILLGLLLCCVAQAIRINHLQANTPVMVGAYSPIDVNKLNPEQKAAD